MANKDGDGFAWSQMWVAWRKQPTNIQKLWMVWKINPLTGEETGLKQVLTEIMEIETRDVQNDVFGHAPKDVQENFGYVPKVEEKKEMKKSPITWSNSFVSPELRKKLNNIMEA